jgi:hypothetical protein
MARMFRAYRPRDVIGDFSAAGRVGHARAVIEGTRTSSRSAAGTTTSGFLLPGRLRDRIEMAAWPLPRHDFPDSGGCLVFSIYSQAALGRGSTLGLVDGARRRATDIAQFHRAPARSVTRTSCAPCHTSQLSFAKARSNQQPRRSGRRHQLRDVPRPSLDHVERLKSGVNFAVRRCDPCQLSTAAGRPLRSRVRASAHAQSASMTRSQAGRSIFRSGRSAPHLRRRAAVGRSHGRRCIR